jgi:rhodanese-related sulfurtransferase
VARTLEQLLNEAQRKIARLTPAEALAAAADGALIVDIRSDLDRARTGVVPGSVHIPRTVLEWRVAPDSPWRNPHLGRTGRRLVLVCDHGYSSSLAASTLVELGLDACDVVGGFDAWLATGLPVASPSEPRGEGELAGMRPPEPGV